MGPPQSTLFSVLFKKAVFLLAPQMPLIWGVLRPM